MTTALDADPRELTHFGGIRLVDGRYLFECSLGDVRRYAADNLLHQYMLASHGWEQRGEWWYVNYSAPEHIRMWVRPFPTRSELTPAIRNDEGEIIGDINGWQSSDLVHDDPEMAAIYQACFADWWETHGDPKKAARVRKRQWIPDTRPLPNYHGFPLGHARIRDGHIMWRLIGSKLVTDHELDGAWAPVCEFPHLFPGQ